MKNLPQAVHSNQLGPHEELPKLLARHRANKSQRPIAEHTSAAFEQVLHWLDDWSGDVIIDACCGVGESTIHLSHQYPNAKVIGIDKSSVRLDKHAHYVEQSFSADKSSLDKNHPRLKSLFAKTNYMVIQADLNDFWRLLHSYISTNQNSLTWRVSKQCIFYPNPYPKKAQVGKRWHASPTFPFIIACCKNIELRSNWRIYVEEFVLSAAFYHVDMQVSKLHLASPAEAMTPFERKYSQVGQELWSATTFGTGLDK